MLPILREIHAPRGHSALGRVDALNAPSPASWPAAGYIRSTRTKGAHSVRLVNRTLLVTRGEVIETGTARDGP